MSAAIVLDQKMNKKAEMALPAFFNEINSHNLYLYAKAYLAGIRSNSANVKTRSDVKGGGKKPWAQKGGGRARAGSITSPVFVGGGVAHGPSNNKNYTQKINKKQVVLALKYALNEKAKNGRLFIVDDMTVASGKTKDASEMLNKLAQRDVLVVNRNMNFANDAEVKTFLAFRNIKNAYLIEENEIDAYIVSTYKSVLMHRDVFEKLTKES
ncbi:MAG: large subunit ribosomal protein [Campylobacterota bacterium]|nr:large subunit ribosomal protein [Campylobacterota bacterium]